MSKLKKFFFKLKKIKNIELYLALFLAVVVVSIVFLGGDKQTSSNIVSQESYIDQLENKLVTVIGNIDGCTDVEVAISYADQGETVYAYQTTTSTLGDKVEQTTSVVMVKGEPLVVKVLQPQIDGVVVVSKSKLDVATKFKIIQVVVTLLDIDSCCVQVFS